MGVKPGTYTWSVALRDEPTGLTSFVVVPALGKSAELSRPPAGLPRFR